MNMDNFTPTKTKSRFRTLKKQISTLSASLTNAWWRSNDQPNVVLKDFRLSKDLEFTLQGCGSSPSTEYIFDLYDSFSTINSQPNLPLHYDIIKANLCELMKLSSGELLEGIQWHCITKDNIADKFKDTSNGQLNVLFLYSAFIRRWDLLEGFLKLGAYLNYYETNYGLSALHLAAFSGCKEGVDYLLSQRECDPNAFYKCYTPLHCAAFGNSIETSSMLLDRGANIHALTNDLQNSNETVLHCAIRANAVNCIKLLCEKGANVVQPDSLGKTSIHLASEMGCADCLKILIKEADPFLNLLTKEKHQTALHLAAENEHADCISILLDHGACVNVYDNKGQTPLHLAALVHDPHGVKLLLKIGEADPTSLDNEQRTPLHFAVSKSNRPINYDIVKMFLTYGAEVNAKDQNGCTPLHLAILNEATDCVDVLILSGADITAKCAGHTAFGMIYRKTPMCIDTLRKKLDESVTFSHHNSSKEVEVRLDFTPILQHCYPKEVMFLQVLVEEGQKELLLHPLCSAFLFLKWNKIKKYFIMRAIFYLIFVLLLSSYILTGLAYDCYNYTQNTTITTLNTTKKLCLSNSFLANVIVRHPSIVEVQWYVLVLFAIVIFLRKIWGIMGYSSLKQYLTRIENFFEWGVISSVFLISFVYTGRTYEWQNHVSAFAVLLAWTNLMYTLGQLPLFGPYVCMYISVQSEFAKVFSIFCSLLIGFTISFCILFPESPNFSNFFTGFITVLVMAIGELNLDLLISANEGGDPYELKGSTQFIYTLFVLCVAIILLNLLLGIAVHDIHGLKKTAKLNKLVRQTKLIAHIEHALSNSFFERKIVLDVLLWAASVSSKPCGVLYVKPLNPRETRLPKDTLQAVYDVAKRQKKKNKNYFAHPGKRKSNDNFSKALKAYNDDYSVEDELDKIKCDIKNLSQNVTDMKSLLENNERLMKEMLNRLSCMSVSK
ncbi:hypothetical protein GWI33_021433 [Rhynchophorus ferrugineus]|uniref:Transient receptor potential channel pyrexia n=1 Tax=Rhynchophorus ferrugineus TaxID=354439 RepID=A0A834HMQ1_RHYFE|nr:hypothetical protein GWI33_021433 [Rhynchophorus ferrugineus]